MRIPSAAYLGNLEEALGDVDNTTHLLHVLDAGLDGLGVVGTSAVEDVLDLLVLSLSPGLVAGTAVLDETAPDGEQADGNDRLLVHDVVLIAEGVDAETGSAAEDGRLAEQVASGEGVDDALGLLLGLLGRDVAGVADGGDGESREGSAGDGRSEEGSACLLRQYAGQLGVNSRGGRWIIDLPTALRAKREAIVMYFDGREEGGEMRSGGGLVGDRELGMEVEVLSR